jgi:hypothetical protein
MINDFREHDRRAEPIMMTTADAQAMVEDIIAQERGEVVTEADLTEDPIQDEEPEGDELDEAMTAIQAHGKMIARLTDSNDHQGALLYVAERVLRDKKLTEMTRALQMLHNALGHMPRELINLRDHVIWPKIRFAVEAKFGDDAARLLAAF